MPGRPRQHAALGVAVAACLGLAADPGLAQDPRMGIDLYAAVLQSATVDDLLPDLSIGRLAVDSPEEALTTVDKIITYDTALPPGDWRGRSLFVANWHAKDEFSGPLDSMAVRYTEPIGLQSVRLYATDEAPLPNALGRRFLEELNHGALVVSFSGHGAAGTMQYLLSTQFPEWDYLSQMRNGGRLPLVLALSCLNGLFTDPRTEGLSELFTELPDGGAIAYISATAISFTAQNSLLQEGLYSQLFAEGQTRFGPALDVAKARLLAAHPSFVDVPQTMHTLMQARWEVGSRQLCISIGQIRGGR